MAVFVDLDDDLDAGHHVSECHFPASNWPHNDPTKPTTAGAPSPTHVTGLTSGTCAESLNENKDNLAAMAMACYPISSTIASSIDLNCLDNLSRTCRSIRTSLVSNRKPLMESTLRCTYQDVLVDPEDTLRFRARAGNWYYMEDMARMAPEGLFKSGDCARDMVSECRRCGTVVCRNCAIKPPAPITLAGRHRRLCSGCAKAPITELTTPPLPPDARIDSVMMRNAVCTCPDGVWLCQPCGRSIRSADDEYNGIWKWRTLYGEQLGGVGIGIGDGDRGVICGRGERCCQARAQKHEVDCDAEDRKYEFDQQSAAGQESSRGNSPTPRPLFHDDDGATGGEGPSTSFHISPPRSRDGSPPLGPGYARHEIVGIGGVVKKKLLKMVRVGACVPDWEDEKARGIILDRERDGRVRSWCGWCWRVIPSEVDLAQTTKGKGEAS